MTVAVSRAFGVTAADLLGSGWESTIYALRADKILRIPRPENSSEAQLRAQVAFLATLPTLPFAVPKVREISRLDGHLYVIEDRIAGRPMNSMLAELSGEKRDTALRNYLAATEAMSAAKAPGQAFGDLLSHAPRRRDTWSGYLTDRVQVAARDEVLAAAVPGLSDIAERLVARLNALPEPARCIVHGDIYPSNVMMNDDLQVTGVIDFSFTTRVGDHIMDLAGACHFLFANQAATQADHDLLMQQIQAKHGPEVIERIGLYAVWFAFDFAFNHDDAMVFAWCTRVIRDFGAGRPSTLRV